jgi:hypothetical protein
MRTNVRLCIVLSFAEESGGPPYHGLFCRRNRNLDVLSLRSGRVVAYPSPIRNLGILVSSGLANGIRAGNRKGLRRCPE